VHDPGQEIVHTGQGTVAELGPAKATGRFGVATPGEEQPVDSVLGGLVQLDLGDEHLEKDLGGSHVQRPNRLLQNRVVRRCRANDQRVGRQVGNDGREPDQPADLGWQNSCRVLGTRDLQLKRYFHAAPLFQRLQLSLLEVPQRAGETTVCQRLRWRRCLYRRHRSAEDLTQRRGQRRRVGMPQSVHVSPQPALAFGPNIQFPQQLEVTADVAGEIGDQQRVGARYDLDPS
jgi:hypothetical protein